MALTGKHRFRQGYFGVYLEVEHGFNAMWADERRVRYGTEWRAARMEDLLDPALSHLTVRAPTLPPLPTTGSGVVKQGRSV